MSEQIALALGTTKGTFVLRGGGGQGWAVTGPGMPGQAVDVVAWETDAATLRLLAGGHSAHWGPSIVWSDDLGVSWREPAEPRLRFPRDSAETLRRVWQIRRAGERLYVGVEPAALFVSSGPDAPFELVRGLWDHPHRPQWQPGGGGLCLHTVLVHPDDAQRLLVAISTGGVYRSDDGGETWRAHNHGIATPFLPVDEPPEFGQCVHKVDRHPSRPDVLFLQHHWGVYRSDDGGGSWSSIGRSLPSDFGFPIVVHPQEPDTVYVVPLTSDEYRCTPDGRLRVYRSRDGGATWAALSDGLPQQDAHVAVLRDAFAPDDGDPAGLYFGTRTGDVYASFDGGDSWTALARDLPPVLCVRATVLR